MGKVMSVASRQVKRFNVENRAHRLIERQEKPKAAPKYESNLEDMQRTLDRDPEFFEKLNKKDSELDQRLKTVYVTSKDEVIERVEDPNKPLPKSTALPDDFEYGHLEPKRVRPGRCTLRQAMQFITDHQSNPEVWTQEQIAHDYKLNVKDVANILQHFRSFNVYIPDSTKNERILTSSQSNKLLKDTEEEQKK